MDWKSFEEVVKYIYENIGLKSGLAIEGYGSKCIINGKSGVSHQIDVLFSHTDGVHKYRTAIECKYWNSKVKKDIIMKMQSIVNDCNFDKGIIVSKDGFTASAVEYAKHCNIGLVELREPNEFDPEFLLNRIKFRIKTKMVGKCYEITNLNIIPSDAKANKKEIEYLNDFCSSFFTTPLKDKFEYVQKKIETKTRHKGVPTNEFDIAVLNGCYMQLICEKCFVKIKNKPEESLYNYLKEVVKKIYETYTKEIISTTIEFPKTAIFWSQEDLVYTNISRVIVDGRVVKDISETFLENKNYALMVMKVIFENKRFVLHEDGTVIEREVDTD